MKILQVARTFYPAVGGIESVTEGLARSLQRRGHHSDVLALRYIFPLRSVAPAAEFHRGLQIYRLPHLGGRRYPVAPAALNFVSAYDLVHLHAIDFFVDYFALTQRYHQRPIVVNTHGGIFHTRWLEALKRLFFASVTRQSLRRVARVICDSDHDYRLFSQIVPPDKLCVIRNGVDLSPYSQIEKRVEPGLLVGVGRLVENKRVERLVDLVALLARDLPDVRLVWVGRDEEGRGAVIRARAEALGVTGRVTLAGELPLEQLQALLSRAHLFVSAASYEAFGISTIEAMGSATVPVVTPVGIHPEVIQEGETGFLLDLADDLRAVATLRAACELSAEQLAAIGSRARRSSASYSWDAVVEQYEAVYHQVIAGSL